MSADIQSRVLQFGGIIFCGGQSTRMGRSKAWLPFDDETMLNRIVRICDKVVHPICVVGSPGQELPTLPDSVLIARDAVMGEGPLRGLSAGLAVLAGRCEAAFVCACDTPLLQPALIRSLTDWLENHEVAVPEVEGRRHPLLAVYRLSVQVKVEQRLQRRCLSMQGLLDDCDTRIVHKDAVKRIDPALASFRNVNTPEAYDQLRSIHRV